MPDTAARLRRSLLAGAAGACLSGCYAVNDARFSAHVQALVAAGMPFAAAVRRLEDDGFACDPRGGTNVHSCARTRRSLLSYACVERVDLVPAHGHASVERVEVARIVCAGP
ncbi:hypothetical protein [uncultured Massilia sp.]|uniref:hypothetical protein n=1 Tax=uncultured Massilia sp. TaxID=169973 RepID=UPI0025CCACB6|nr:hypothetical protein [uncultured Massilia sp.]